MTSRMPDELLPERDEYEQWYRDQEEIAEREEQQRVASEEKER